nr:MAG TPA: hypothetical protein [Caudoviricetes sp.]
MIVNYPRMRRRTALPTDLATALEFSSPDPFIIYAPQNWDGTIEYSIGGEWQIWDGSDIASGNLKDRYFIYLRGTGNTRITLHDVEDDAWYIDGALVSCNGNIERLLDWEAVNRGEHPTMSKYCFAYMFWNCKALTSAPSLPATTLANGCYNNMFQGCTNLATVPALPSTTLVSACYALMFSGCTEIKVSATLSGTYTKAYRIPKTGTGTMAANSLNSMFAGTGGTFKGTPEINTTYYLDESNTIV